MFAALVRNPRDVVHQLVHNRNVNMDPCSDGETYDFHGLQYKCPVPRLPPDESYLNQLWALDLARCQQEHEFMFQRTVMMSMIDRDRLFTNGQDNAENCFKFSTECVWSCPQMPTRGLCSGSGGFPAQNDAKTGAVVSMPRPDLCICFRTDAVITRDCLNGLSMAMKRMINVEKDCPRPMERAFPFLIVEAKNSQVRSSDKNALAQVWNAASQALHNMYEFFLEAGMEDEFFHEVRFFTVVAVVSGCSFRMHRAVKNSNSAAWIVSDYPLKFEYIEIGNFDSVGFMQRDDVVKMFEKMTWGYGSILRDLLRRAGAKLEAKMKTGGYGQQLSRRKEEYYRHGQRHYTKKCSGATRNDSESRLPERPSRQNRNSERSTSEPTLGATTSPQYIPRASRNRLDILRGGGSGPYESDDSYQNRGRLAVKDSRQDMRRRSPRGLSQGVEDDGMFDGYDDDNDDDDDGSDGDCVDDTRS